MDRPMPPLFTDEGSSPTELLDRLLVQAESSGASDIHFQTVEGEGHVAFRMDGLLVPYRAFPRETTDRMFGRIKYLARLKTYQDSLPQEGRIPKGDSPAQSEIRVSTYPTVTGEKMVLRLFTDVEGMSLDDLGFPVDARLALLRSLSKTSGMLLLTGPAGSGKTTTIYACLDHLAQQTGRHIITIEDPVERIMPGVMQTEVQEASGLTFAKAAKHLLRQDPQVLVLGEIRDEETARIAVRAAFTGHLVISTLHAGSCKGVFERLFDMCDDRYAVLSALDMIINQRLIRKICQECVGKGCDSCFGTGFRGRLPVVEWLLVDEECRSRVRDQGPASGSSDVSLQDAAKTLVTQGVTSAAEYRRMFGT